MSLPRNMRRKFQPHEGKVSDPKNDAYAVMFRTQLFAYVVGLYPSKYGGTAVVVKQTAGPRDVTLSSFTPAELDQYEALITTAIELARPEAQRRWDAAVAELEETDDVDPFLYRLTSSLAYRPRVFAKYGKSVPERLAGLARALGGRGGDAVAERLGRAGSQDSGVPDGEPDEVVAADVEQEAVDVPPAGPTLGQS